MKFIVQLIIFVLLLSQTSVFSAEISKGLKEDFRPIKGTIIMPIGDDYLIDLDASTNLKVGDILTLVMDGEKVIDPASKQIVKIVTQPKGFLQVTKVKSGYSYAKLLTKGLNPQKGDNVSRYVKTPTIFKSTVPTDQSIENDLKKLLPNLKWLNGNSQTSPELIFQLTNNALNVLDAKGQKLRSYEYINNKIVSTPSVPYHNEAFQLEDKSKPSQSFINQAVSSVTATLGLDRDKRLENPAIISSQQLNNNIWQGPNLNGNPTGIAVGDFDGDGKNEIAVTLENKLQISRFSANKMIPITTIELPTGIHILALDSADTDKNGIPELFISASVDTKLSSLVIEYRKAKYTVTIKHIPWLFRSIIHPSKKNVLLAHTVGNVTLPISRPFFVSRESDRLIRGETFKIPKQINPLSFSTINDSRGEMLYTYISSHDQLKVATKNGTVIWESPDSFGGTESFFYTSEDSEQSIAKPIYIQPRIITLTTNEILVATNEGIRFLERYKKFSKSHLTALKWGGNMFAEKWRTSGQAGYLADFTVEDANNDGHDELVMIINFKRENIFQKGRSSILIYKLTNQ